MLDSSEKLRRFPLNPIAQYSDRGIDNLHDITSHEVRLTGAIAAEPDHVAGMKMSHNARCG